MKGGLLFQKEVRLMSTYEAISLMIAFAMLVTVIVSGQKK